MKYFLITLLLLVATPLSAQTSVDPDKQALYNAEVREKLALDYSMPDFSVKKMDEKTIGPRLAKQLQYLIAHYQDHVINNYLSEILYEQAGDLRYTIKILEI